MLEREASRLAVNAALVHATRCHNRFRSLGRPSRSSSAEADGDASGTLRVRSMSTGRSAPAALEWTRLEVELLELDDEDAANEAALCVRVDGRSLVELDRRARRSDRETRRSTSRRQSKKGFSSCSAPAPGELVGPLAHNGACSSCTFCRERRPIAADPELRQRAVDLRGRARARARASRHGCAGRERRRRRTSRRGRADRRAACRSRPCRDSRARSSPRASSSSVTRSAPRSCARATRPTRST